MAEFVALGLQFGFYGFHALPCLNGGRACYGSHHHCFGHRLGGLALAFDFHAKRPVESDNYINYNIIFLLQQDLRLSDPGLAAIVSNRIRCL